MSKKITIGSKEHFFEPLKKLLIMGNEIHKHYSNLSNNNLTEFLSLIPTIEPNKIDSFLSDINNANFIAKLKTLGVNTDFDYFSLKGLQLLQNSPNLKDALIYYYSIYWAIDPLNEKDFSSVLSLLQTTKEDSQIHDLTIHNFCFELVLSKSISSTVDIEADHSIIPYFLQYIMTLSDLPSTSFSIIIALFGIVDDYGNEFDKSLLCDTVAHMFKCNFTCLKDNDYSLILNCLKINLDNLNVKIVRVLSLITQHGNLSLHVMDIIHNLYKELFQLIKDTIPIDNAQLDFNKEALNFQTNKQKTLNKFIFLKTNHPFQLTQLPLSSVSFDIIEKPSILPQSIYSMVVHLSDFLMNSSNQIILDFIAQFSAFFGEDDHFYEMCYTFLSIFLHLCGLNNTNTVIELLSQSHLFSSSLTIFDNNEFYLDSKINFLRDQVFELLVATDPSQVSVLIHAAQFTPYLLAEHLLRILLRFSKFDPVIFSEESVQLVIMKNFLELQSFSIENDFINLNTVRTTIFLFIQSLLWNQHSVDLLFSQSDFSNNFLNLAYEPGLEKIVFDTFRKSVCIMNPEKCSEYSSHIVNFFRFMNAISIKNRDDDKRYDYFVLKAYMAITIGIQYNISIATHFVDLFYLLLSYIESCPSLHLFLLFFKLFQTFAITEPYWTLSNIEISTLHSQIEKLCGNEPDERIVKALFCCLENSSYLISIDHLVIKYPPILSLLFLIHSKATQKNIDLLTTFNHLCKHSNSNAIAFHTSYIDYLLIQYLCFESNKGKVFFINKEIEIDIDREKSVPIIIEILKTVIMAKTDYSIALNLIKLLKSTKDERISSFIIDLLYSGESLENESIKIPMDTAEPFVSITGVNWNYIQNSFTIDFYAYIDKMISNRYRNAYTIFTLTDSTNAFTIQLKNGIIRAYYKTPEKTSSAFLFKNISSNSRNHFTIVVSKSNQTKIANFLNADRISDVNLDLITMNGPIKILLGGSDYLMKSVGHPHFGTIFNFNIYPFGLNEAQIQLLTTSPYLFKKQPLFSTELLSAPELSTAIDYNYSNQSFSSITNSNVVEFNDLSQETDLVIIEKQAPFHIHSHILTFLCDESLYTQILDFRRIELSLDLIHCLFTKKPEIQIQFRNQIQNLSKLVSQNASYKTYFALFRIMQTIIDNNFKLDWFEIFIINIVLWSQSDEFRLIVNHWNVIMKQYKLYFQNKNYLNELLTQFMLRFAFDKNSEDKNEDIMKTFCNFLLKIARLNFDVQSFEILISCILVCDNEIDLWQLTRILYEVSTNKIVLESIDKEKLQLLHKLFQYQNTQLIIYATLALNNMSIRMPDYDPFVICYKILGHSDLNAIVDSLLSEFPQNPNLISLLVVLALHTKKLDQLVEILKENFISDSLDYFPFTNHKYWYVWPILLYLNASDEQNETIAAFVAKAIVYLSNQQTKEHKIIDEIFAFLFRISEINQSFPIIVHVMKHLILLYESNNRPIPKFVAQYCYTFFFIHFREYSHHSQPLLDMFRSSLFYDSSYDKSKSNLENKFKLDKNATFNIFDLESLLQDNFSTSDLICRVCIDSPNHLSDYCYYKIFDDLNATVNETFDKSLLHYFVEQKTIESKHNFINSQIRDFDAFKDKIGQYLIRVFKHLQRGILDLLRNSRRNISSCISPNSRHFTHIFCTKASSQLQRNTFDFGNYATTVFKRRNGRLSQLFVPFQLKRKLHTSKLSQINIEKSDRNLQLTPQSSLSNISHNLIDSNSHIKSQETILFKCHCTISKFDKLMKYRLRIYDDKLCFISEKREMKVIFYNNIKFLLARKFNDNLGYEIYSNTLRTLLFFVDVQNFTSITTYFKTSRFDNLLHSTFSFDPPSTLPDITKKWQARQIGNFEYLMYLNMFSGHSFNQFHLYPVMPNILTDFNNLESNPADCSTLQTVLIKSSLDPFFDMSVESNFTDYLEVSADYFFDFCNNNNSKIKLPTWAKDKFEFIAKNRRKLEEIDISTFIDYCFGVKSLSQNYFFIKLFKKEHEKRIQESISPFQSEMKKLILDTNSQQKENRYKYLMNQKSIIIKPLADKLENNEYSYDLMQKIISVAVFKKLNNNIYLFIVFGDLSVACVELIDGVMRSRKFYQFDCGIDDVIFSYSARSIFGYSKRKSILYIIQTYRNVREIPLYTDLPLFSAANDLIYFCTDRCSLMTIHKTTHVISKFCSSDSKITCLNASGTYNAVVYSTMNGFIHFWDMHSAKEISKVNMHDQIVEIVISVNSGFVNVMTKNAIDSFTINGEFVSSFKIGLTIKKLFPFYSKDGIDFISFATVNNEFGYFDSGYPDKYIIIKKYSSQIQKISFDPIEEMFIIILENGHIELLPYTIVV